MFFAALFSLAASSDISFGPYVEHITDLPPDDGTGYFVMLHKHGCGHCVRLAPTWSAAAELGHGIAHWCELNCDLNDTACRVLQTEGVPRTLYFLNGRIHEYQGMQLARLLVNWASAFVNDTATVVDASNYTAAPRAAILFTERHPAPKVWAAVERVLARKDIPFFVSSDRALQEKLGAERFPGVYALVEGQAPKLLDKKLTVRDAVEFLQSAFAGDEL